MFATVSFQGWERLPEYVDDLIDQAHDVFPVRRTVELLAEDLPEGLQLATKIQESHIISWEEASRRREAHVDELASRLATGFREMHDDFRNKQRELREKMQAERSRLDSEFRAKEVDLRARYDAKDKELAEREAQLQAERAEIDDLQSRDARRKMLEQMRKRLESLKAVKLSSDTTGKRSTVRNTALIGMVFGLVLCTLGVYLLVYEGADSLHFLPLSGGTVLFSSMLVYYLRWNDAWHKRHADAEFENMAFERDIMRASWLAELLFEWGESDEKGQLPQALIDSYSRHLFVRGESQPIEHPAETLTSLLREAESMKVGKGLFEFKRSSKP